MAELHSHMTTREAMSPEIQNFFSEVDKYATKLGIKELCLGVKDPKKGGVLILASPAALGDGLFRLALSAKFDLGGDGDDTAWPGS